MKGIAVLTKFFNRVGNKLGDLRLECKLHISAFDKDPLKLIFSLFIFNHVLIQLLTEINNQTIGSKIKYEK